MIEAAANGACAAIPLALNIAGNLIAFLGILALLNGLLGYFGGLVGIEGLSFEVSWKELARLEIKFKSTRRTWFVRDQCSKCNLQWSTWL